MYSFIKKNISQKIRSLIDSRREQLYLNRNSYKVQKTLNNVRVTGEKIDISLRKTGSDWQVFKQIFQYEEYKPVVNAMRLNKINPTLILDLGANIGLTTFYLKKYFPETEIISVEPDENNFICLELNLKTLTNVKLLNVAVWNESKQLIEDAPFRGGDDWAKNFKEKKDDIGKIINGLSIEDILKHTSQTSIDLLKIDIEGAERFLFNKDISNLDFLAKTKCIAIEIHDEFNCREDIYNVLSDYGFIYFNHGELTIGVNRKLSD